MAEIVFDSGLDGWVIPAAAENSERIRRQRLHAMLHTPREVFVSELLDQALGVSFRVRWHHPAQIQQTALREITLWVWMTRAQVYDTNDVTRSAMKIDTIHSSGCVDLLHATVIQADVALAIGADCQRHRLRRSSSFANKRIVFCILRML